MPAPSVDADYAIRLADTEVKIKGRAVSRLIEPLRYSGSLEQFDYADVTPVIGREFPKLQLSDILSDDTKIRDLAITGGFRS